MSNQLILWLALFVPWLSLPFMKEVDRKRFMPSAFFSVFTSLTFYFIGVSAGFWYITDEFYPFIISGLLPVTTLWVIRFTYGRFWTYFITNAVLDLIYAFIIIPWSGDIGILGVGPITTVMVFVISVMMAVLIYYYQAWQEKPVS